MPDTRTHWENIYKTKSSKEVSWYQPHLAKSLEFILGLGLPRDAAIIDIGGVASTLPDDLLAGGFKNITVLDVSSEALKISRDRLGSAAKSVRWIEADITQAGLDRDAYDLWHDRAVFHFLIRPEDRAKYVGTLTGSLKAGGFAMIAAFGPHGPPKCSGLEVVRYSAQSLLVELGDAFKLEKQRIETHQTPFGATQEFLYSLARSHRAVTPGDT
jgi:hypothetical protein